MFKHPYCVSCACFIGLLSPSTSLGQPDLADKKPLLGDHEVDDNPKQTLEGDLPSPIPPVRPNKRFFAGGKLGANIATFGGPDADGTSIESTYSLGFAVQGFARFAFTKNWSLQSEFSYTTRGTGNIVQGTERSPFDFSYVELTLAARAQWALTPIHERLAFHALLGPSVGYLLSAKRDDIDLTSIASVDYGLQGGVGLSVTLPVGAPVLDLRYYYGIPDLDETERDVSHRAFSILLGYEVAVPF